MRYRRARIEGCAYFFTQVTHRRRPFLTDHSSIERLRRSFRKAMENHPFTIDAIVVLPDHMHCIRTLPKGDADFSTRWRLIKGAFSRGYRLAHEGQQAARLEREERMIWQRRFWEHAIRDETDFSNHVDYIHYNPVKHGLVSSPMDWRYSSFHRYVRQGVLSADWGARCRIELPPRVGNE